MDQEVKDIIEAYRKTHVLKVQKPSVDKVIDRLEKAETVDDLKRVIIDLMVVIGA